MGYKTVSQRVDELYFMYSDSCMSRAEGDSIQAERLFDTTYWDYYWRVLQYNRHCERVEAKMKEAKSQNK